MGPQTPVENSICAVSCESQFQSWETWAQVWERTHSRVQGVQEVPGAGTLYTAQNGHRPN